MKILFLTDNFPPEVNAPATRTYEHCKEWVKQGATVTVITTQPNFPHGTLYDGYQNKLFQQEVMDGIRVIRVWTYITANEGIIKRTLDYFSFTVTGGLVGLFQNMDVIVTTSPQFLTTWAGCLLGFLKRKPWVFELRDLWPESIVAVGAMKTGRLYDMLEAMELFLYRRANLVIPNSPAFKKNLISRGIAASKIHVISNGANLERYSPRGKDEELIEWLGLKGKFVIGYIGTHGMAHSLDFIVESITEIKDPDIHFLFVGDGALKTRVVSIADKMKLRNATFLPSVTKDQVARYLSLLDAALVSLKRSETFKTVIPSKIFESGAMGIPLLVGVDGQTKELVEQYQAGIYFEPENRESFLSAVELLKKDRMLWDVSRNGGLNLAKNHDRKQLAVEMLEQLKTLVHR